MKDGDDEALISALVSPSELDAAFGLLRVSCRPLGVSLESVSQFSRQSTAALQFRPYYLLSNSREKGTASSCQPWLRLSRKQLRPCYFR